MVGRLGIEPSMRGVRGDFTDLVPHQWSDPRLKSEFHHDKATGK